MQDQTSNQPTSQEEIAENGVREIEAIETGVPPIAFHLVEKHHNKTTQLLSNSGTSSSIQAKNRWHDYDFKEPIFLGFVDIAGSELSDSDEYKFKVTLENGKVKEFRGRPSGSTIRVDINEFCKNISFKPPSIFFNVFMRSPELQKVSLWGFRKSEVSEFLYKISRIGKIKNQAVQEISEIRDGVSKQIEALNAKSLELQDIDDQIATAEADLGLLNTSIAEKEVLDSELQSKVDRSHAQLENIKQQVSERREELDSFTKSRENERREVELAKAELKKLNENINLFPSEISGFVNQASRDIRTYMIFFAVLLFVIVSMFVWVLTGAFDLSEFVKKNPEISVWPLLMAKLPLAMAVSAIVAACYKISKVFVEELLRINRQKLSLTQVSIIAKDVSQAAESGLDLSDVQIYGLRLRAKMALLSDHLMTFVPSQPHKLLPQTIFDAFDNDVKSEDLAELLEEGGADAVPASSISADQVQSEANQG